MMDRVTPVEPQSYKSIERAARILLERCAPECLKSPRATPIANILEFDLVSQYDFGFGVEPLSTNEHGYTDPLAREIILSEDTYERLLADDGHARFTSGHEAGHALLHAGQLKMRLVNDGRLIKLHRKDIKPFVDPEWQANAFSAALLMPAATVRELTERVSGAFQIARVVSVFKVSVPCARIRLEVLQSKNIT